MRAFDLRAEQRFDAAERVERVLTSVDSGDFTCACWEPGQVTFSTTAGSATSSSARIINQHVFTSGVPSPGGESVRISLYVFHRGQIPLKNENEVIIDKFEYLP